MNNIKFLKKLEYPKGYEALKKIYKSMNWIDRGKFISYAKVQYEKGKALDISNSKAKKTKSYTLSIYL